MDTGVKYRFSVANKLPYSFAFDVFIILTFGNTVAIGTAVCTVINILAISNSSLESDAFNMVQTTIIHDEDMSKAMDEMQRNVAELAYKNLGSVVNYPNFQGVKYYKNSGQDLVHLEDLIHNTSCLWKVNKLRWKISDPVLIINVLVCFIMLIAYEMMEKLIHNMLARKHEKCQKDDLVDQNNNDQDALSGCLTG